MMSEEQEQPIRAAEDQQVTSGYATMAPLLQKQAHSRRKGRFHRRWLYLILVILFLVVVIIARNEAIKVIRSLLHAAPHLLVLAVLAQAGYYLAQTGLYQAICQAVGLPYHFLDMLPLTVAWPFINVTVPAAGLAGVALLADDARQRDMEPERAVVAGMTYLTFTYASFSLTIWAALLYLHGQRLLQPYQVGAGLAHALGLAGILLSLGLAGWAPRLLTRILDFLVGLGRRLSHLVRRSDSYPTGTLAPTVDLFNQAVRRAVRNPRALGRAVLCVALAQGANLLCFYLVVRSLEQKLSPMQLTAAYGISYLVTLVSPTPQGIGFTEGATVAIFSSLGESFAGATAVTLAFRGVTFWLPLAAGLILVRCLRTFRNGALGALRKSALPDRSL